MEDVSDMSIREPVSTHMKCGPMRRKSMVLINSPDTQVYPMATPDATGDLNDDTGFHTVLPVSGECIFSSGNKCQGSLKIETAPTFANMVPATEKRTSVALQGLQDVKSSNFVERGEEPHL